MGDKRSNGDTKNRYKNLIGNSKHYFRNAEARGRKVI
jgi:hypothetical protein